MPTDRFACLVAAAALALAALTAGPHHVPPPWDRALHVMVYAAIAALLWVGTEGRAPLGVTAAVIALGAVDEMRQLIVPGRGADLVDFFADVGAAAGVAVLFLAWAARRPGSPPAGRA